MRVLTLTFAIALAGLLASFSTPKTLTVTSSAFTNNNPIPVKYTCMGAEFSPPLHIDGMPAGTKSLAVVVYDPDAEIKVSAPVVATTKTVKKKNKHVKATKVKETTQIKHGFTHWVMWNVDATQDIPENFRSDHTGLNSAMERNYKGMCPPTGTHHYQFIVYALDTQLNIDGKTDKEHLEKVMDGHVLAKGMLVGIFNKNYK